MRKSVGEIIEYIKRHKGLTRDYEVAECLGIARGALSNAKQRDSLSFLNELVDFCVRENVSLDLLRANGPGCANKENAPHWDR